MPFEISKKIRDDTVAYLIESNTSKVKGYINQLEDCDFSDESQDDEEDLGDYELKEKPKKDLGIKGKVNFFFPSIEGRQVIFIAGRSGAGKSVWIRNWCMLYQKLTKRPVFMISSKTEDESTDQKEDPGYGMISGKLNMDQVELNEDNIDDFTGPYILDKFKNSTVIFDDVFNKKPLQKKFDFLLNMFIALGRQNEINILVSRHQLQDMNNKLLKEECTSTIVFPNHSFKKHILDYLKQIGMERHVIGKVVKTKDRWVAIRTQCPLVGVTSSKIFNLNE